MQGLKSSQLSGHITSSGSSSSANCSMYSSEGSSSSVGFSIMLNVNFLCFVPNL